MNFEAVLKSIVNAFDERDIHMLLQMAGSSGDPVDWELIEDYLSIFSLKEKLEELRQAYDAFK